jgi:purine nucleoside phosphorylase
MPVEKFSVSFRLAAGKNSGMSKHKIGVIGGSGLYSIEGFTNQKWVKVKTPFGSPSDELLTGKLAGRDLVFLYRATRGATASCPVNSIIAPTSGR